MASRKLLLLIPLIGVSVASFAQQSPYPVFENDKLSPTIYKQRRELIKRQIGPKGVAVFFTNPTRNRNNDTDFRYRGDSNFLYLTGFEEPEAALILAPGGIDVGGTRVTEVLFTNVSTPQSETWLGYRMNPSGAKALLGVEAALPNSGFGAFLAKIPEDDKVWKTPMPAGATDELVPMIAAYTAWAKTRYASQQSALDTILADMRLVKSPEELKLLRHAIDASVLGHLEVVRSVKPGMREYEVQALVEYVFTRYGCEYAGYPSIVGTGANGTILHYEENRAQVKNGDMIVMDAAGEYHGYSADVTRTFPANGKFTPEQRKIYDLVLAAQNAGIGQIRPGKSVGAFHQECAKVLAEGLVKLGIIKNPREVGRYFMHGAGHPLGLDVHDEWGTTRTLKPGITMTCEPGIYIKAGSPCDPKWWNIGCRIEDDILVTEGDPVIMSAGAPRKAEEIEALMKETGIGNIPVRPFRRG